MIFWGLILSLFFFSASVKADPAKDHNALSNESTPRVSKTEAEARKSAYLYDVVTQKVTKATPPLKAGRIYLRFEPTANSWVFDFPDEKGFRNPPQYLMTPSVVRGDMFGLSKKKKYRLSGKGPILEQWIEVSGAVKFFTWVPGDPPHKITYEDPETEYVDF